MKRYDERMLHLLLDRYESSLLYDDKNKVNISISVPLNKRTMPDYFDITSTNYDTIHEQLREMEEKGYLTLVWGKRKKHILEKCVLNLEYTDVIYQLLHRVPRKEKEGRILELCDELQTMYPSDICLRFLGWVRERINSRESVKEYVELDEPQDFCLLVKTLYYIENNVEDIFLRQFSIRVFHDSKIAEQMIGKATRILSLFQIDSNFGSRTASSPDMQTYSCAGGLTDSCIGGPTDFHAEKGTGIEKNHDENYRGSLSTDEILAEYHIFRNPSWLMLKGHGACYKKGTDGLNRQIDLEIFTGGMGISNEDISHISWDGNIKPAYVITIENLTSFHQWNVADGGLCIYLGGYANAARRSMLQSMYQVYEDVPFYHFGDIDCGGFLIWKNLCESTGISFKTKCMDIPTYETYLEYGRELTERDKKQLSQMLTDPFFQEQKGLFQSMLAKGKKLEQECVV